MLVFIHCHDISVTHWFSKSSESPMFLNTKELTLILTGWQGKDVLYRHLSAEFKLKSETSVPCLLQAEMCWPKCISALRYALSNTTICHSRIKALEHMHAAHTSPPLPAHSTNPLRFASHRLHVPFYTAPYSIPFTCRQFVSSSPPWQDMYSLIV